MQPRSHKQQARAHSPAANLQRQLLGLRTQLQSLPNLGTRQLARYLFDSACLQVH